MKVIKEIDVSTDHGESLYSVRLVFDATNGSKEGFAVDVLTPGDADFLYTAFGIGDDSKLLAESLFDAVCNCAEYCKERCSGDVEEFSTKFWMEYNNGWVLVSPNGTLNASIEGIRKLFSFIEKWKSKSGNTVKIHIPGYEEMDYDNIESAIGYIEVTMAKDRGFGEQRGEPYKTQGRLSYFEYIGSIKMSGNKDMIADVLGHFLPGSRAF